MGCGPSTKETSLHHFRDPLVEIFDQDLDTDLAGVIVVGTPQDNYLKHLVGERAAAICESMGCQGAVVSADGWGNSDVDFANTLEQIGNRNIEVVGLKFIGKQAKFVVENNYTKQVLDINKSSSGTETEVVGENMLELTDARKALAYLKLRMRNREKE